jgi:hypothetical protein
VRFIRNSFISDFDIRISEVAFFASLRLCEKNGVCESAPAAAAMPNSRAFQRRGEIGDQIFRVFDAD